MNATTKQDKLTLTKVRALLRPLGVTVKFDDGEYEVKYARQKLTYYTDALDDVLDTGREMAAHKGLASVFDLLGAQ